MTQTADTGTAAAPVEMVNLTIDGVEVSVPKGTLVIRAAELIGVQIPRFCDHPLLDPVGACRQCLVEVALPDKGGNPKTMMGPPGRGKPQASCTLVASEGMVVRTQTTSEIAEKAQRGNMEFLLINHPLDCPVCDKGGECPLQNQAMTHGQGETRFTEIKRTFPKPIQVSEQVLLDRERCVLCARCTRFSEQIAGDPFIELIERGSQQQVGIYEEEPFHSYFSGNTIQICPVGALTSADYRFRSRPFDLVSTPSVAEHDACGAAIRVDHRRGKVMRRLAGNDPEVNEEWITDKDRFAFGYLRTDDRLAYPQVREDGELRPASWPEAFAVAARGLAEAGRTGVLPGGRLTAEDAFAYSTFARVALGTNDVDFRSRPHSREEAEFLASEVVLRGPGNGGASYADLESANSVLLVGLEPEDEAGTIFLRLRKAQRKHRTRIWSVAPYATRGLRKMGGTLIATRPGAEAEAVAGLTHDTDVELDSAGVILVGERMATVPGALTAVARLARTTGAKLAWVPRRAGDRGAVETGCLPQLLPGGRPLADAAARVDAAAAWGVASVPEEPGRDADAIVAALASGELGGLVVGGVDPDDTADPAAFRAALEAARFVGALEPGEPDVTRAADVVFPVAPVTDKPGTFVNWEGRPREFPAAFVNPSALPDARILAGIAEELGTDLGFRTSAEAHARMVEMGPWDGERATLPEAPAAGSHAVPDGEVALATWKLMLDNGSMQDGEKYLRATARTPVCRVSPAAFAALGEGAMVTLTGDRGSVTLPVEVADDMVDGTVWVPANSTGNGLLADLASPGSGVRVKGADQ